MHRLEKCLLAATLLLAPLLSHGQSTGVEQTFHVIERELNTDTGESTYFRRFMRGTECTNNALNRLTMLSENQETYPEPESGCGPTSMLNILIWYEKYGLIQPLTREADTATYKLQFFNEIDQRLIETAGQSRTESNGTHTREAALVMDTIVSEQSANSIRLQSDYFPAPLELDHFLTMNRNFRAGTLIVRPKDPQTQALRANHAVTVIRADRAGYITLGTWGKIYRGILKTRGVDQWFVPSNPEHLELKIVGLIRFIPFEPTIAEGP